MAQIPIFDGHNDVLLRLLAKKTDQPHRDFLNGDGQGHMDLPRIKAGHMMGGLFAIFPPPDPDPPHDNDDPNPPPAGSLRQDSAIAATDRMLAIRDAVVAESQGAVSLCLTVADIRASLAKGSLALVTHFEGAEVLAADLGGLQGYYDLGLRSLGLVWSRPNVFGEGVPFRFPSSPDTGNGLTEAGKALVRECNRMGILVDVSHLNEKGFWDVVRTSKAPFVASHSNVHALSASSRNLTDDQLRAIADAGGLVGLNFATGFLREDGRWNKDTPAQVMLQHLEHMLRLCGEDGVALGSDFDGARIPAFIKDCSGLPALIEAMGDAGFDKDLIEKIAYRNWLRVLEAIWGK